MFRLLAPSVGTLSDWCGRNVDALGIRLCRFCTMSEAMRSDVNGLTMTGAFFGSDDGVDDADDDEKAPPPPAAVDPLLLLFALRSSG